ncbi:unnamed protein product [Symbiodinium sp. KB8]|nr:unnamed protein product [Symbiodinium sp. KB8]
MDQRKPENRVAQGGVLDGKRKHDNQSQKRKDRRKLQHAKRKADKKAADQASSSGKKDRAEAASSTPSAFAVELPKGREDSTQPKKKKKEKEASASDSVDVLLKKYEDLVREYGIYRAEVSTHINFLRARVPDFEKIIPFVPVEMDPQPLASITREDLVVWNTRGASQKQWLERSAWERHTWYCDHIVHISRDPSRARSKAAAPCPSSSAPARACQTSPLTVARPKAKSGKTVATASSEMQPMTAARPKAKVVPVASVATASTVAKPGLEEVLADMPGGPRLATPSASVARVAEAGVAKATSSSASPAAQLPRLVEEGVMDLQEFQRPGQQNRELSRYYEAGESSLETSLTAESEAPETSSRTSHALTPREKALFGYVTWSTSRPPPMTIFVRPYLQALTRRSSQRAGKHTDDDDDEDADPVVPVPSPSTPPSGSHTGEKRGRPRRLSSRSTSLDRGPADVKSSRASGSSAAVDPRGRSPLPRRRGVAAGDRSAPRDVGYSKDGEPFLLPKPKRFPLRKPASPEVEVASSVTVPAAVVQPQATTKPTKQTKQTKQTASLATNAGGPTATTRLRKFRTPKSALKYTAAKQKPLEPSPPRGADPKPQPGNEVSIVDPPAVVDPPKTRRPLRQAQTAARDPRAGKRQRTLDPRASSLDSSLKAPLAVDSDPLPPTPADGAGGTETLKAAAELSSASTSVRRSAVLPEEYLYSEDGPLATAKRPRCKGIWFIPEPEETQDDPETCKGAVSSASLRAYKELLWRSFMCELWCFPHSCHMTMPFHVGRLRYATMQGLRLCYGLHQSRSLVHSRTRLTSWT